MYQYFFDPPPQYSTKYSSILEKILVLTRNFLKKYSYSLENLDEILDGSLAPIGPNTHAAVQNRRNVTALLKFYAWFQKYQANHHQAEEEVRKEEILKLNLFK